jgi:hypothetical protein
VRVGYRAPRSVFEWRLYNPSRFFLLARRNSSLLLFVSASKTAMRPALARGLDQIPVSLGSNAGVQSRAFTDLRCVIRQIR